jgi:hypothetical protein
LRQIAVAIRRGISLPVRSALFSLLAAVAVSTVYGIKDHKFGPSYVLRAVEADRDAHNAPRTKRHLRDYVMNAVFSNSRLLELMDRYRLYRNLRANNPQAALESFREDIEVDVYRNFFVEERDSHGPPRSARIVVRYQDTDPKVATAVTHALGRLIVQHESTIRRAQAEQALARASHLVTKARQKLYGIQQDIMSRQLGPDPDRKAWVEIVNMRRFATTLERMVETAERRKGALELGERFENKSLGLSFEIVDEGAVPRSAMVDTPALIRLTLFMWAAMLPLMLLIVGVFDRKIRNLEDVRRLGFRPLGKLALNSLGPARNGVPGSCPGRSKS